MDSRLTLSILLTPSEHLNIPAGVTTIFKPSPSVTWLRPLCPSPALY